MGLIEALAVIIAVALAWAMLRAKTPPEATPRTLSTSVRLNTPAQLGGSSRVGGSESTRLFGYGVRATGPTLVGHAHRGPYAALAIATTGLSPANDRIVELAVVRVSADGRVVQRWSTVLNPGERRVGLSAVHGLTAADLATAPDFGQVAGTLVGLLGGAVVVAHNAEYVEEFLQHEFLRASLLAPSVPALSATRLAQLHIPTANYRLGTVGAYLNAHHVPDGSAVAEAAVVADLIPHLVPRGAEQLVYPVPPLPSLPLDQLGPSRSRSEAPPGSGSDPWLDALMRSASISALEIHDPRAAAYIEMLTLLLSRGYIVTAEARELSGLAAQAGFATSAIRTMLERFCEVLRRAAFVQSPDLGPTHLRHLRAVAASVGLPTYFDDLIPPSPPPAPEPGSGSFARPVRKPLPPTPPALTARCGHCLTIGHWTADCPQLGRRGGAAAARVTPIAPI